jgi:hypothetical protein
VGQLLTIYKLKRWSINYYMNTAAAAEHAARDLASSHVSNVSGWVDFLTCYDVHLKRPHNIFTQSSILQQTVLPAI